MYVVDNEAQRKDEAADAAASVHRTQLRLHMLLVGAVLAAALLGALARRAEGAIEQGRIAAGMATRIDIVGPIDNATAIAVTPALRLAPGGVNLYIDSQGGDLEVAEDIMGILQSRTKRGLITRCFPKEAMSAAFFILMRCDVRVVEPSSTFMAHYPYRLVDRVTIYTIDELFKDIKARQKEVDKWAEDVFKEKAALMKKYMYDERYMTGAELCKTFKSFCGENFTPFKGD